MSMWYLYTITNQVNGKQYIGISVNTGRRFIERKSGHGSVLVYQAIKKYGLEKLVFNVLYEGCEEEIKQLEITLIAEYGTIAPGGYNLTEGGEGTIGWKHSTEMRQEMSKTRKGEKNGMYGKKHSKETRKKIGAVAKGRKNPLRSKLNKKCKGATNPRARKVLVNNKKYDCIKNAAEAIGMTASALRVRFSRYNKTGNWPPGRRYLD